VEDHQRPSPRIELRPTLSQCIETTAKRAYWKSVDVYLKENTENKELEERIELLRSFLETADFSTLRSQSERSLVKGNSVTFTLFVKDGKPCHSMTID